MFLDAVFTHSPLFYFVQSFWRDEAFSVLFAQQSIFSIITKSLIEPPVFYLLLHFWVKLFGLGEVATRTLSLLGFMLATIVIIEWSDRRFGSHWLSKFIPAFFFLNPMLLYYAFEVRAYGWYVFFASLSLFAYDRKRWGLYTLAVTLGLYTHLFLGMIPMVHGVYEIATQGLWRHWRNPRLFFSNPLMRSLLFIGIAFIPWIIRLMFVIGNMKNSWYFPVDINLIQSVLGNMFVGYEGTPWNLWPAMKVLSFILLNCFLFAVVPKEDRKHTMPLLLMILLPLTLVIGFSFIKPIFVNRYLIPVTIAQVLLLGYFIKSVKHPFLSKAIAGIFLLCIIGFNIWYPQQHAKQDVRSVFNEINRLKTPTDLIIASEPIIFMETLYYTKDASSVRLFNPTGSPFPWYIGDAVFSPSLEIKSLPYYPNRAFFIEPDGSYTIRYNVRRDTAHTL